MSQISNNTAGSDCQERLVRLCSDHGYSASRDHDALYDMSQSKSVVCFVDYHECRDVACTLVRRNSYGTETEIGARGLTYIAGMSREEFVMQCRRYNVEFILPNDERMHHYQRRRTSFTGLVL